MLSAYSLACDMGAWNFSLKENCLEEETWYLEKGQTFLAMKTSEELTQKIAQQLNDWQKSQENQTSGFAYEKSFTDLWQKLGQEVFQSSLGDATYQKNRKKKSKRSGEKS